MKPRSRRLRKKSGGTTELYQGQGQVQRPWFAAPAIPDQSTPVAPIPAAPAPAAAAEKAAVPAAPGLTAKFFSFFSSNKPASGTAKEPSIFDKFSSKLTGIFSGGTKKRKRNNKSKRKGKGKK